MKLARAKLFVAFAGLVALATGLWFYDWRLASIAVGVLLIAAVIGSD